MFEPELKSRTGFSPSATQGHPGAALQLRHFRRPKERPFTADQRGTTTILFGNLTPKHEELICAVFRGSGYNFQNLPAPGKASFRIGREYCSNGLCNPNYFTAGSLVEYLRKLRNRGLSPAEIRDRYVYFTLADCGPCRLGTYQSEYRQALDNAGFPGFRVITFERNNFISGGPSEPGLKFNADIGFGCLNALTLGDILYESAYEMRPYERSAGETDRAMADCVLMLSEFLRCRPRFELLEVMPSWLSRRINARHPVTKTLNSLGKYRRHLYDNGFKADRNLLCR